MVDEASEEIVLNIVRPTECVARLALAAAVLAGVVVWVMDRSMDACPCVGHVIVQITKYDQCQRGQVERHTHAAVRGGWIDLIGGGADERADVEQGLYVLRVPRPLDDGLGQLAEVLSHPLGRVAEQSLLEFLLGCHVIVPSVLEGVSI